MVIIGGSYHQSEDLKDTPVGRMSGLQVQGKALATWMDGSATVELDESEVLLMDVALAIGLVLCGLLSLGLAFWAARCASRFPSQAIGRNRTPEEVPMPPIHGTCTQN